MIEKKSLIKNLGKNLSKNLAIMLLALATLFSCSRDIIDTVTQLVDRETVIEVISDDPSLDSLIYQSTTFAGSGKEQLGQVVSRLGFPLRDFKIENFDPRFPYITIDGNTGIIRTTREVTNYQEILIQVSSAQDIERLRPDLRDEHLTNDLVIQISDGILVYNASSRVPFNQAFTANPSVRSGYSLTNYQMSYTTNKTVSDGTNSIYLEGVQEPVSFNSDSGRISFPAGFRVGFALEVTIRAGVDQANGTFELEPGDEIEFTFQYEVVDNGVDTDGDGVNDGLDPDIDGDGIPNQEDPRVFSPIIPGLDIAFVLDVSGSINDAEFTLMRNWVQGMISSLSNLDIEQVSAKDLSGFDMRFHVVGYYHRGAVQLVGGRVVVVDDFRYPSAGFGFQDDLNLSEYLSGVRSFARLLSPDTFTPTAMRAVTDVAFLGTHNYQNGAGTVQKASGTPYTGARQGSVRIMVVLTDGEPSSGDFSNISTSRDYVLNNGISVIAIGIGLANLNALRLSATAEGTNFRNGNQVVFPVAGFDSLDSVREQLIESIVFEQQSN